LPFLADKLGEIMDNILRQNALVSQKKLKLVKQSSDVDFKVILDKLDDDKK
jgi:hypothetical protein